MFRKLWTNFLDMIFPINCISCGKFDYYLCPDCQKKLKFLEKIVEQKDDFVIYRFFDYKENNFSKLIHLFKYRYIVDVFQILQEIFLKEEQYLRGKIIFKKKIYYLPVPLHIRRQRERGYNQAEKLAEIFQKIWPGEIRNDLIIRSKYTKAQAKLNRKERLLNLKAKFSLNLDKLKEIENDTILIIVDDVMTTGSTLLEIQKLLSEYYPGEIQAMVLARDF